MGRLDWYILRQLFATFGFFALVLVLIYWINHAVRLFDQLISDGQTALVFFEFSILTLPSIISTVTPIAVFASAVYITNRLASDSELVVFHATGFSARRLARPFLIFGAIVSCLVLILTHLIVPLSRDALDVRQAEVAENLTARLLTEGTFLTPTNGVTFYLRNISAEGELQNVFLDDARNPDRRVTYSAGRAFLVKTEHGPKLAMVDGLIQAVDKTTNQLSVTRFNDFVVELGGLVVTANRSRNNVRFWTTAELLADRSNPSGDLGIAPARLNFELNDRTMNAFLCLAAAAIGFSVLASASFSRFGIFPQIFLACILLVLVKLTESASTDFVLSEKRFNILVYTPILVGMLIGGYFLLVKDRVFSFSRKRVAS